MTHFNYTSTICSSRMFSVSVSPLLKIARAGILSAFDVGFPPEAVRASMASKDALRRQPSDLLASDMNEGLEMPQLCIDTSEMKDEHEKGMYQARSV